MKVFLFFFLFTVTVSAQNYVDVFSGRVTDGDTTSSTLEFNLVNSSASNLFDTLHVLIQAGDSLTAAGIVYAQTGVLNRWSQGIPLDTLTASAGQVSLNYPLDQVAINGLTPFQTDTLKNRWFLSTGAGSSAKERILANAGWKIRFFVVGTTGNHANGGYFKVTQWRW